MSSSEASKPSPRPSIPPRQVGGFRFPPVELNNGMELTFTKDVPVPDTALVIQNQTRFRVVGMSGEEVRLCKIDAVSNDPIIEVPRRILSIANVIAVNAGNTVTQNKTEPSETTL